MGKTLDKVQRDDRWVRLEAGHYRRGRYEISRDEDGEGGQCWFCLLDGWVFDRAATLAEAKSYCNP